MNDNKLLKLELELEKQYHTIEYLESKVERLEQENKLLELGRIKVTKEFLQKGCKGSFTSKQLKILGLKYPLSKNWQKSVLGKFLTRDEAYNFMINKKRK